MNKIIYIIIGIVVIIGAIAVVTSKFRQTLPPVSTDSTNGGQNMSENIDGAQNAIAGNYAIDESSNQNINWSGKRPLILGYVDSGTFPIKSADVVVGENDSLSGNFVFAVENLQVGLVAKKPGQEGSLAKHLKSDAFFNVEKFPEATFTLKSAERAGDDFSYNFVGDLSIKNIVHEISFPAVVYSKDGSLNMKAETKIDRTKWDMTFASGNFFQNLGDSLVDDMVDISFDLTMGLVGDEEAPEMI